MDINSQFSNYFPSVADILYGSYIKYDRLYEMTKFAFYGKTDSNDVNIFIDLYSIYRSIYIRGTNITINDSYAIASCSINLAIHLRAYFETRHNVNSKVYLIYGGARPSHIFGELSVYNAKNICMENNNSLIKQLISDNLEVISIIAPYLFDIFSVVDYENEFSVIVSSIINKGNGSPNIIYTKDALAYQLVAFKPRTFIYRPKKSNNVDVSWVVTKSTLFNAYRHGELGNKRKWETKLDVRIFSIYQTLSGVKSRSIRSIVNTTSAIGLLENAVDSNIFANGYNASLAMLTPEISPFGKLVQLGIGKLFQDPNTVKELISTFRSIDLPYQTAIYESSPACIKASEWLVNLYNPQEVRNINDKYFTKYPLDLNRV